MKWKNLEALSCDSNQIHTIEQLPDKLVELHISNNQLTNFKKLPNSIEELHAKNNLLKELKVIPKSCTLLDVRNNLIEDVKVTKSFKNLNDISILGNYIKDVDSLIYKLNKLEIFSDIIPEEESSNSESEIDFENMSDHLSEDFSDDLSDDINEPKLFLEGEEMKNNGEITPDDILNFSKKLNKKNVKSKKAMT